jgi:hypothetical protein
MDTLLHPSSARGGDAQEAHSSSGCPVPALCLCLEAKKGFHGVVGGILGKVFSLRAACVPRSWFCTPKRLVFFRWKCPSGTVPYHRMHTAASWSVLYVRATDFPISGCFRMACFSVPGLCAAHHYLLITLFVCVCVCVYVCVCVCVVLGCAAVCTAGPEDCSGKHSKWTPTVCIVLYCVLQACVYVYTCMPIDLSRSS